EPCPHCGYPAENYPSIAQSWGILGIMIGTALFVVPALIFAPLLFGLDLGDMSFGAQLLISTLMGTGIPCWIVYRIRKKKTNISSFNLSIENRRIIPLIVLVAIPLNLGIAGPLIELVPMNDFFADMIREIVLEMASDQGLLMFTALVIAAPILEELIFRGVMLDGLLRIYSPTKAVIVSSLLFGLIHLNPAQFVGGALVGGFMGWVYVHTRSVMATILIHAAFNLTAFTESYFIDVEEAIDMSYAEILGGTTNYVLVVLGSVVVTLGCGFLLDREFKKSATIARA
ncbi:MAG: type II CAAX endopeptidase family protein, partial [Gemmatimonadota bacterium]|nr:type II CAAX endopeptidase family protein [Gemmatimonadota bacterium]